MWCRCVREDSIVRDIVFYHSAYVECTGIKSGNNLRWACAQVAQDRDYRDAEHVISKPPSIWPSARNRSVTKPLLNRARQRITSENTQSIKGGVRRRIFRIAGQTRRAGRQVYFDQVRNEDPRQISSASLQVRRNS